MYLLFGAAQATGRSTAQIHPGFLDIRHTAGQDFLRIFQDGLAVSGGAAVDLLGLLLGRRKNLRRALLRTPDDLLSETRPRARSSAC